MSRPRTPLGSFGEIHVVRVGRGRYRARTYVRDQDGKLRDAKATAGSRNGATRLLKERIKRRPGYGTGGMLTLSSPFGDLADLWLADLAKREIKENTKENYRDDLRVHVRPFFGHYTLGEITTGRAEAFLQKQLAVSYSMAKHSRTLLNLLFNYALRLDAIPRSPVEGTSPIPKPKGAPQALTPAQIIAIRRAAAVWRTEPGLPGPKPDGQVRDAIEVLLGTGLRPGEALALRPVDISITAAGMVAEVNGTVVYEKGKGTFRQDHPKTDASVRRIPVPEFAARVIVDRLARMGPEQAEWTIFHNRKGGPLSQHNFRRTFREFLKIAGLEDSGISPRWYRRTGATILARGLGVDAAATHLGHTSSVITEGYYIEPDQTVDHSPAAVLERTLRPDGDMSLLTRPANDAEEEFLDEIDSGPSDDDD